MRSIRPDKSSQPRSSATRGRRRPTMPPASSLKDDERLDFMSLVRVLLVGRTDPDRHSLAVSSPANRRRDPAAILALQYVVEREKAGTRYRSDLDAGLQMHLRHVLEELTVRLAQRRNETMEVGQRVVHLGGLDHAREVAMPGLRRPPVPLETLKREVTEIQHASSDQRSP